MAVHQGSMVDLAVTEKPRCWGAGNQDTVWRCGWKSGQWRGSCDSAVTSGQSVQHGWPTPHHRCSPAAPAAAGSGPAGCVSESAGLWRRARMGVLRMSAFALQHERGDADQSGPPWHHLWKPTWEVLHAGQWHTPGWTHLCRKSVPMNVREHTGRKIPQQQLPPHNNTLRYPTDTLL